MVQLLPKKQVIILSGIFLLTLFSSQAATYTTMADGNWTDPTIWSTDGGATSCGCIPPEPTAGNDIHVKNIVDLVTYNVTVTGGSLLKVFAYQGEIHWSGGVGGKVNVQDGEFYINNYVDLNTLDVAAGSICTIIGYSTIEIHNTIQINGKLDMFGGYFMVSNGNLTFSNTADIYLTNFSKIEVSLGNLTNNGNIFIAGNCCIETRGTWKNQGSGTVNGDGAAISTAGSFQNSGAWQATVDWCGGGSGAGMPPMNCPGSINDCGMLVLGATFGELEAFVINEDEVELAWTTISERNNDYFLVQRSANGYDFETIGLVDGNGTTEWEMSYEFVDPAPYKGLSYYRLEQVDLDGDVETTPLKSIQISSEELTVVKSYNLMGQEINENYSGVVIDLLEDGTTRKRFKP